mgnify:CR=1 FL=1
MIRCCVFDLDGTLVNSLEDLARATNFALKKNGLPAKELEEYRYFVGDGVFKLVERAAGGKGTPELLKKIKADFDAYYATHYHVHTAFYPGILPLLQELKQKGIKLAVISNKPHEFAVQIVSEFAPGFFDCAMGNSPKFPKKPDPASLSFTMETLGVSPEETLFIGDSNVDIFTGHNAGVKAVGVTWGFRPRKELMDAGADYLADTPHDLLQWI